MKLPRRKLGWMFWTSTVVAVVLLGATVATVWISVVAVRNTPAQGTTLSVFARGTLLHIHTQNAHNPNMPTGWNTWGPWKRGGTTVSAPYANRSSVGYMVGIPLYLLAAPFVIASTVMFIRAPRRAQPGCCGKCGYDLSGIAAETCPECGQTS